MAEELGEAIAESLTDMTCSDVKLKRNDKVISINAARERIKVRGQEVEYSFDLLFCRVACVITSPQEMKHYLQFEFAKNAPSLFENVA